MFEFVGREKSGSYRAHQLEHGYAENEYLDESEWNTRIDQLYKAIDRLPDRTREIFKRIVLDGKRHKEVAEEFEISVTTVKTLLARALAALRAELSEKTYSILLLFV